MGKQKLAWKEAIWIFGLSRLLIIMISYRSVILFPIDDAHIPSYVVLENCSTNIQCFLQSWWRWDTVHYVEVAYNGYHYDLSNTAFFPLFPLLMHSLGTLLGGSVVADYTAGLILANICFYGALVLFYQLVCEDFDHNIARKALFYLALAPYAIFFFTAYTESLFLLLSLAVFFFLRRGRPLDWWLAGLCGFLAVITRSTGIILLVPFFICILEKFGIHTFVTRENWGQKLNAILSMVLIPSGLLIYMFYLWKSFGNPWLFSIEQTRVWFRSLSFPWMGIFYCIKALFVSPFLFQQNLADLFFTLMPLTILIIGWKHLPLHYTLFSLAMILYVLCYPVLDQQNPDLTYMPLMSVPRYLLVIFPIFILLGQWSKHPRLALILTTTSLILFGVNIVLFVTQRWVA
jgi:hypothetical protein